MQCVYNAALSDPLRKNLKQPSSMLQEVYEDGAYLVRQGEPGSSMFVMESGEVLCTHRSTGDVGEPQEVFPWPCFW